MRSPFAFLVRMPGRLPPEGDACDVVPVEERTAPLPRRVWIELTSRCPYDCPFCSRRTLRGHGANMPLALYRRILGELGAPEILRLNYSGESAHHPHIVDAVAAAAATGAWVELVSVPAALPRERLAAMVEAGLNRLTVSLHTLDAARFRALYGFGSLSQMLENLRAAAGLRGRTRQPFVVDVAFVAAADNLAQLPRVAALAAELGLPVLAVHPVIRRTDIPQRYAQERDGDGELRSGFRAALEAAVAAARAEHPQLALQVSTPEVDACTPAAPGAEPAPWPGVLPPGARLHGCDQDPFETLHILADGKVVTCEVRDIIVVGDLATEPLAAVWHGQSMREFRAAFAAGRDPQCRTCAYKRAYAPRPLAARLTPGENASQLLHGWHAPDGSVVWSKRDATLTLARPPGASALRLSGVLPPGPAGANVLAVNLDGVRCGEVANDGSAPLRFVQRMPLPPGASARVAVELHAANAYRPVQQGSPDVRELGFALVAAEIV